MLVGLLWFLRSAESLNKALLFDVDSVMRGVFDKFFPEKRAELGQPSFQRGDQTFKMMHLASRAEYHIRHFLAGNMRIVSGLIAAAVGAFVILGQGRQPGLILASGLFMLLLTKVHTTITLARLERDTWGDLSELTHIKGNFERREIAKSIALFGLSLPLIRHLEVLGNRVHPRKRRAAWRRLPFELFADVLFVGCLYWCLRLFQAELFADRMSIGEFSFLLTTLLALGRQLSVVIETLAVQGMVVDMLVDLFRFVKNPVALKHVAFGGLAVLPEGGAASVEAKNFTFSYPGRKEPVIRNLSLSIEAGETVYILGDNGVGKTTLFNGLSYLFPLPKGQLFVDGYDVATLNRDSLGRGLKHLPQEVLGTPLSIRQMLAFSAYQTVDEADTETMWEALRLACLDDKVREFKGGLDEPLAVWRDAVESLSGGQRKKLNIAMFFMGILTGNVRVVVLDEPVNALDPWSAKRVLRTFEELDVTVIITSHTVREIPDGVQVIYLEQQGDETIAVRGTKAELLESSQGFRHYCAVEEGEERAA